MKKYVVEFTFNTLNKRSRITKEYGEVDMETDVSYDELLVSTDLLSMIAEEMADVTGKAVLSVKIKRIYLV